ncbi:MAG: hypothetical protein GY928_40335, partial [Colwellia sp.]|nr:hypothetical protein [Colwellia sp.]
MNINSQLKIKPIIPTTYGPIDYRIFCEQLENIDRLLIESGVEIEFLAQSLKEKEFAIIESTNNSGDKKYEFALKRPSDINKLSIALRTNIVSSLLNESYRDLSFRFADSSICQWFIGISTPIGDKTPGKSTIQRYEKLWREDEISDLITNLNRSLSQEENSENLLFATQPLDFTHFYADTTCIESNIHYPIDWLLLRDATNTLVASIKTIRTQGLFHRIPSPSSFTSEMNSLTMAMTEANRNRKQGTKKRKKAFRAMKLLLKKVVAHGERYHTLLENRWEETDWTINEVAVVINRIKNVLDQVPAVVKLANDRIISGKLAKQNEKILSLYEKNVHVIKRGKAQGDIEFGNTFYIAEQKNGLIVDWDFLREKQTSDKRLLKESVTRIYSLFPIESFSTDRGFNTISNSKFLEVKGVFDATCANNPHTLQERLKEEKFCKEQKRRAQTEGRIGIIKNKFIGQKILRKGFEN